MFTVPKRRCRRFRAGRRAVPPLWGVDGDGHLV